MEPTRQLLKSAIKDLFELDEEPKLTRSDEQFGDAATNVALQLAAKLQKPPAEIAARLVEYLNDKDGIAQAEAAGPGFINIRFTDQLLWEPIAQANSQKNDFGRGLSLDGKSVVAEYSDPNPFKVLHAGHLYTSVVGDAIANLLEARGAKVHRVNFGGDVGMHVAKTMWAVLRNLGGENPDGLNTIEAELRPVWLAKAYMDGNNAYDNDEAAKAAMTDLNKLIYQIHAENDRESGLAQIYWMTRQWSYDYFDSFYSQIGTKFEKYYPESENAELGLQTVKSHIGDVFKESEGAVVFDGEPYGLHTRVFINSEGLPTYEAKDVGLIMAKWRDYHFDLSLVITGNEQAEYMKVVLCAVEQFEPNLAKASVHRTHGIVKLAGGQKMSSRKGNILTADEVLRAASLANEAANGKDDRQVSLGAVKYSLLKHRLGGDIVYDAKESVSLHGNSGPYLQYALVRARSVLSKAGTDRGEIGEVSLEPTERSLAVKLSQYPEVVLRAAEEYMPHILAVYLYELAQVFNQFYEQAKIIGDERQTLRLALVGAYAQVLSNGLDLLGIPTPQKM